MLRKTLSLGMAFIFAVSLLLVSMVTCFTYDAEAHNLWKCTHRTKGTVRWPNVKWNDPPWFCFEIIHHTIP